MQRGRGRATDGGTQTWGHAPTEGSWGGDLHILQVCQERLPSRILDNLIPHSLTLKSLLLSFKESLPC